MSNSSTVVVDHEPRPAVAVSATTTVASSARISFRQLIGVSCCVVVCDLAIYRGEGFAGLALLFLLAPLLLWLSSQRPSRTVGLLLPGAMLVLLAARMSWSGSAGLAAIGFTLVIPYVMVLAGFRTYVRQVASFTCCVPVGGWLGLVQCVRQLRLSPFLPRITWIKVLLPLFALVAFGWVFLLANPRMWTRVSATITLAIGTLSEWVEPFRPELLEAGFWLIVVWAVLGLVRPVFNQSDDDPRTAARGTPVEFDDAVSWHVYAAARNTLAVVIVLFAGYLLYEFANLWFREFEDGFHYSGYAHEGAAWLTVALGLATVVLSLVFQGRMLTDRRVRTLKRLAWTWSCLNVLLALAVYNRLFIYIEFNGLTRMRIVGLFGISTVVVGFAMVVWKIARGHSFAWLVHRQLVSLAIAVYLFALTPVDSIWVRFNVGRILAGDLPPAVQLSVHPIGPEGLLQLAPLLECDDVTIREGVRAMLAEHHEQLGMTEKTRRELGWTSWQLADQMAFESLDAERRTWEQYSNPQVRKQTRKRFDEYTYQWY